MVVVGSGVAGLVTALELARDGAVEVTVVTKGAIEEGNTRYAQGGIAAAVMPGDTVESHRADTLAAGAGLGDAAAVSVLCAEGPERIRDLIVWGVEFDRVGGEAAFDAGLEGAHSFHRILHAGGDATGFAVETALVRAVRAAGIRVREATLLVDLVTEAPTDARGTDARGTDARGTDARVGAVGGRAAGRVVGVVLKHAGGVETLAADAVVLASGGLGQLFAQTTNPAVTTGDGAAAALRAGAVLADVEFVQFHPTALAVPGSFLVSEAVRGDGAVLRNSAGERFMVGQHPLAELAPRDVVARSIAAEMERTGAPVLLDATALGSEELERRFPTISAACRAHGFDWSREPVPVAPAAHYWMGGVATDLDARTSLAGLFAVGEVACTGVHGANRLASNSLLESLVFAHRCAAALRADLANADRCAAALGADLANADRRTAALRADLTNPDSPDRPARSGRRPFGDVGMPATSPVTELPERRAEPDRAALRALMQRTAGVHRSAEGLREARAALAGWQLSIDDAATASVERIETANLLVLARAVVASASARQESRGAHHRADFPDPVPAFAGHLVIERAHPEPRLTPTIAHALGGSTARADAASSPLDERMAV